MRVSDNFSKLGNFFVYFGLVIVSLILSYTNSDLSNIQHLKYNIFLFATLGIFYVITIVPLISFRIHAILSMTIMLTYTVILALIFSNSGVFLVAMSVTVFSMLLYLDSKLYSILWEISIVLLTVMVILNFPGMNIKMQKEIVLLFYIVFSISCFALRCFVNVINFRQRKSDEQDQSIDDLLKVVYAKCIEAQNTTKSKSNFLSNMSHEIRTPINAILGMNEMILRESKDDRIIKYATNVENSSKMLLSLINDILDFSKIESGKMELVFVEYQFSSVLNDLVNMVKPRAEKKKLDFILDIDKNIPCEFYGDEVRIKQVLTNVLTNAVKYTATGSITLKISMEKFGDDKGLFNISVSDTGQGMKPESIARLFDSFERFEQERNRYIEGTGLGMAITKEILNIMDGSIWVESEYGKGSTFHISIPQNIVDNTPMGDYEDNFAKSTQNRQEYRSLFTAPNAKILVVDDNEINVEVVLALLADTKVNITTADSGESCIGQLEKQKFDVIFLDHMMPGMDGIETIHEIRKRHLADGVPILALTANAISGVKQMYLDNGFSDYLTKPVSGKQMEDALIKWLPTHLVNLSEERPVEKPVEKPFEDDLEKKEENESIVLEDVININEALEYSASGRDGVVQNINIFLGHIDITIDKLKNSYETENYKDYVINVHALKSTSRTIGLSELADLAYELEMAGKHEEYDIIKSKHDKLLEMFDSAVEKLSLFC